MDSKVPSKPLNHFKKRVPSESKSEFREIDFGILVEQFKDVWTSLVSSHEIFASDFYPSLDQLVPLVVPSTANSRLTTVNDD